MAVPRSISSNCTRLAYAREVEGMTPAQLDWKLLDPASYTGDFGATVEYITAETVGSGRAPQKGRPAGKTVGAQFEAYMRQHELQPFLPGFFINHPVETPSTNRLRSTATTPQGAPAPGSALTSVAIDGYVGTNFSTGRGTTDPMSNQWPAAVTDGIPLLYAQGFSKSGNNGIKKLTGAAAAKLSVTGLTVESAADLPASASVQICGYEAVAGKLPALTVNGGIVTMQSAVLGSNGGLPVQPGTFLYLGGDAVANKFAQTANQGWGRVSAVTDENVEFDLTTFTPVADAGKAGTRVFMPTRIFKDDIQCDASRTTTYAFERRLGHADTTYTHEQSQLVTGSFPNQLDLAIPTKSDVKATLQFMSRESYRRDGSSNDKAPWSGNNSDPIDKSALFNTTFDIKHALLYRHDASVPNRQSVFGLITDGTFTLNNNAKAIEGWGVYGAYDINPGYLMVDTEVTALFTSVEALDLSEEGIEAGLFVIFARENSGFILDVPLVTVQSSALTVDQGEPVMVNVTNQGNESSFGYAASMQFFDYLPTAATAVTTI